MSTASLEGRPSQALTGQRPAVLVRAGFGGFGKKGKDSKTKACPCGSGLKYQACCQPIHESANGTFRVQPHTAEACLRARFSAFALKDHHRLIVKTTALDNPARKGSISADGKITTTLENDIKATFAWADFKNLKILEQVQEGLDAENITFQVQIRKLYELKTGDPIKNGPWETIQETVCFTRDADAGWVLSKTTSTNWDRDKLKVVS